MKTSAYFLLLIRSFSVRNLYAQTLVGPNVIIDETTYSNGQTAYIQCEKSTVHVVVALEGDGAIGYWRTSTNFSYANGPTDLNIYLTLDPSKQSGYVDASGDNFGYAYSRIYIVQKPSAPTFLPLVPHPSHSASCF